MNFNYAKVVFIPYAGVKYSTDFSQSDVYGAYLPTAMAALCMAKAEGNSITVQYRGIPKKVEILHFFKDRYDSGESRNAMYEFAQNLAEEKSDAIRWVFGHEEDLLEIRETLVLLKQFLNVHYLHQVRHPDNYFEITFNYMPAA